ncbi:MAG: HypC/HybG/HupF family hydrogenase formation chaperone [Chloroflexi bacterium]|nr:MAG: HypC/HybG/HupF family hydrogenase formation chaperone [Chloroflexota bacterium]
MCLGVPGKIIEIYTDRGLRMCKIDFGGAVREACLETLPEANIGDYTIVHAGFALNILSEEDAKITLDLLRQMAVIGDEIGAEEEIAAENALSKGSAPSPRTATD